MAVSLTSLFLLNVQTSPVILITILLLLIIVLIFLLLLRVGRVSVITRWLVQVQLGRSQVARWRGSVKGLVHGDTLGDKTHRQVEH